jgi:hypothetical protein
MTEEVFYDEFIFRCTKLCFRSNDTQRCSLVIEYIHLMILLAVIPGPKGPVSKVIVQTPVLRAVHW